MAKKSSVITQIGPIGEAGLENSPSKILTQIFVPIWFMHLFLWTLQPTPSKYLMSGWISIWKTLKNLQIWKVWILIWKSWWLWEVGLILRQTQGLTKHFLPLQVSELNSSSKYIMQIKSFENFIYWNNLLCACVFDQKSN